MLAAAIGGCVLIAGAILLGRALTGDDGPGTLTGPAAAPFRVALADGWVATPAEKLRALPGDPLGIARKEDGKGLLLVDIENRAPGNFKAFTKRLDRELDRRFGDFERRSARTLRVRAGPAYYYSYIRRRRGTVHSIVIVPAGRRSYTLNSVVPGGADDAAREVGRMIVSFDA